MLALSPDERRRYDALRGQVMSSIAGVLPTPTGFRLRLRQPIEIRDVAEWMALEHRCCPFLDMSIAVKNDGAWWIDMGGSRAIKELLRTEFGEKLVSVLG
jgi:hypothetical protein